MYSFALAWYLLETFLVVHGSESEAKWFLIGSIVLLLMVPGITIRLMHTGNPTAEATMSGACFLMMLLAQFPLLRKHALSDFFGLAVLIEALAVVAVSAWMIHLGEVFVQWVRTRGFPPADPHL
jgi:hypothetical protein